MSRKEELVNKVETFLDNNKSEYDQKEFSEFYLQRYSISAEHAVGFYYDIDLGSAGINVIKDLLRYMDQSDMIESITVADSMTS